MKKLSTYLLLILFSFSAPSFADDIRDFQIEGISIGDSLLDYMSEEEIKENVGFVYEDKKFTVSMSNKSSEIYDMVGIEYKSKDKTYKIHGVQGVIDFPNNIEGCYKKQDDVVKDISSMFDEIEKENQGIIKLPYGKKGSTYKPIIFYSDSGDAVSVECYHYSDVPQEDLLRITITTEELREYLISKNK